MSRALLLTALLTCVLSGQKTPNAADLPEEDPSLLPKDYVLNPVQAKREITAGNFYFKKGNYSAAVQRYTQATLWDPGSAEAFLKLGEAEEKLKDLAGARQAYSKYIEINEDPKVSDALRKKMAKWPKAAPASK